MLYVVFFWTCYLKTRLAAVIISAVVIPYYFLNTIICLSLLSILVLYLITHKIFDGTMFMMPLVTLGSQFSILTFSTSSQVMDFYPPINK